MRISVMVKIYPLTDKNGKGKKSFNVLDLRIKLLRIIIALFKHRYIKETNSKNE